MRISDWSSDVCSSDLPAADVCNTSQSRPRISGDRRMRSLTDFLASLPGIMPIKTRRLVLEGDLLSAAERADLRSRDRSFLDLVIEVGPDAAAAILSSAERRVGKECVRTCDSRWSAIHEKK